MNDHDESLVDRDTSLPGLQYLLDAGRLKGLLEGSLGPAMLQDLHIDYLRYKPGVNCLARIQLASGYAYAKAFTADGVAKLAKARRQPETEGPLGTGRLFLDNPGIMLSFFPNDSRLPALARLSDPATRPALLADVFKGDPAWSNATCSPLNYKPERRFVARLMRGDGESASIKFYTKRDFTVIRESRKKLTLPDGLRMPLWIGGSKHHRVIALSWLPGVTLHSKLERGHVEEGARAAEAIVRLHRSSQPALNIRTSALLLRLLDSLGRQLGYLIPELAREAQEVSRKLGAWVRDRKTGHVPIHGDFYDKQVIVQGDAVGVIDSDRMHLGEPEMDLGCFVAHLERRRVDGLLSEEVAKQAEAALLDGYRVATSGRWDPRAVRPYIAFNLFQLSPHPFRDRKTDWPEQTAALLAKCRRLLSLEGTT